MELLADVSNAAVRIGAETMAAPDSNRWSRHVTETSDALSLEPDVFTLNDPAEIARSLSESAEESTRRKAGPFRSAMSMLTFYINRAGKNLPEGRKKILEKAKDELRRLYGRAPRGKSSRKND